MIHLPIRQKITIMLAVMSGMLLAALDQTIVSTALPRIVSELHGLNSLSWVVTAYLLTSTISVPISGKLSDIFGRKKLILIGILVFVAGSALSGLSQNMLQLIIFRAIQGVGAGLLMSNSFAIIGDLFTPRERGRWQGMIGAVFGLSSVVGPLIGGFLTDHASWRWNFYINVPVGIVAFVLITRLMPTIEGNKRQSIDYLGAGLLAACLSTLMLALVWGGNQYAWTSFEVMGMFALSAACLGSFIWVEKSYARDPILPLSLFSNRIFSISVLIMFLVGMAMFGAFLYIPLFAQGVLGRSATNSGVIMMPLVLSLVPMSIVTGQVVSRTGKYKKIAIFGMATVTVGLLSLSTLHPSSNNSDLVIRMVVAGIGLGVAMPIFNLVVQNALPHSKLGIATSSVQLFRGLGSTVGVAIMGSVLNNRLSAHLSSVAADPANKTIGGSLKSLDLAHLNSNQLQGVLSPQAQHHATATIAKLPPAQQHPALSSYSHLIAGLKDALSSSISEVFLISGVVVSIAFFAAWFLKEIPLRGSHDEHPLASEGGAPGATHI